MAKTWKDEQSGVELTVKEKDFVKLYVFGDSSTRGNGSECYRRVYLDGTNNRKPTQESVWVFACETMKKPRVKAAIKEYLGVVINDQWIINELAKDATNPEAKFADRIRAKELLGKNMGMFVEKSEVNIKTDTLFTVEESKN